ncbi:bifunctional riboflavin kinase/FAD synthetase [Glacieibacterium sp.]|uniref:bifunctional riboflavin kinase/FAD synthetase n=1 Tax=Glacieibacterium sp. TaxID=2860237 RepID=UPI003AFFD732
MERIIGRGAVPDHLRGGVVALGNFDGFHAGHQAVVGRALARARAEGRPALVATFDPHPARLFRPDAPPFALTTIPQRLDLFEAFGIDGAVVLPFDHALANETAEGFAANWLAARIGAGVVVSGNDFTFGKGRTGDVAGLARLGQVHGFAAEVVAPVSDAGGTISSSRVREALTNADPVTAATLLTRPFTIRGVVEHGAKLGRQLGFPTANIDLGAYLRPSYGVYAVRVRRADGSLYDGVANLGLRPMIEPPKELLEAWLFDFDGDLYDEVLDVELVAFLRPEMKLADLEALKTQVAADALAAKAVLG